MSAASRLPVAAFRALGAAETLLGPTSFERGRGAPSFFLLSSFAVMNEEKSVFHAWLFWKMVFVNVVNASAVFSPRLPPVITR